MLKSLGSQTVRHDWATEQLLSVLIMADQQTFLCSRHKKLKKKSY